MSESQHYNDTNQIFENDMLYFVSKYFYENYTYKTLLNEFIISLISFILYAIHLTVFQSELFNNHYRKSDGHCDYFCVLYQIFGILSIIFTIIDILKEIHEAVKLKI